MMILRRWKRAVLVLIAALALHASASNDAPPDFAIDTSRATAMEWRKRSFLLAGDMAAQLSGFCNDQSDYFIEDFGLGFYSPVGVVLDFSLMGSAILNRPADYPTVEREFQFGDVIRNYWEDEFLRAAMRDTVTSRYAAIRQAVQAGTTIVVPVLVGCPSWDGTIKYAIDSGEGFVCGEYDTERRELPLRRERSDDGDEFVAALKTMSNAREFASNCVGVSKDAVCLHLWNRDETCGMVALNFLSGSEMLRSVACDRDAAIWAVNIWNGGNEHTRRTISYLFIRPRATRMIESTGAPKRAVQCIVDADLVGVIHAIGKQYFSSAFRTQPGE